MADILTAMRKGPLTRPHGGSSSATIAFAPPAARASLRAGADAIDALSLALGVTLPTTPKTSASADGKHALWIGPDEWLLIGPDGTDFVGLASQSGTLNSATDISHRNVAFVISGEGASTAINSGCPLDLTSSVFPIGACARTVFAKIEIVLYRTGEETYRVECWRSFAEYCFGLLEEGAHDAHL